MIQPRTLIVSLAVSGALLVGIAQFEGYTDTASAPVPGDVPTYGFGTTGPDVHAGDKITPPRALVRLLDEADKSAAAVRRCAPVPMYQREFDAYTSLTYNIGTTAFCNSTAARLLNAGDYLGACAAILKWDKFKGKPLPGLTKRRQAEYQLCAGAAPVRATVETPGARLPS